jgi:hypothetical protein
MRKNICRSVYLQAYLCGFGYHKLYYSASTFFQDAEFTFRSAGSESAAKKISRSC